MKPGPYDIITLDEFMKLRREALDRFEQEQRERIDNVGGEEFPAARSVLSWMGCLMTTKCQPVTKQDIWPDDAAH